MQMVDIGWRGASTMATGYIEVRITALEAEIVRLKQRLGREPISHRPWGEQIPGSFANAQMFEEAMSLVRQCRRSLRPKPGGRRRDAGMGVAGGWA